MLTLKGLYYTFNINRRYFFTLSSHKVQDSLHGYGSSGFASSAVKQLTQVENPVDSFMRSNKRPVRSVELHGKCPHDKSVS